MCEQTPVDYKYGDVVWVKLGPCWWPGEVVSPENLPSDVIASFKKPPLAVVKFFEEENFQYVKNLSQIYSYNCNRKNEFIEKGLEMHRAKHNFMEKFPGDVCIAESKTNGNPNILNDPKFGPKKRLSYSSIFGSPSKKTVKDSPARNKRHSTGSIQSSSTKKKMSSMITHPRFIGKDDHEVRLLVQPSEKPPETSNEYRCHTCGFKSSRIDVIVFHNKSHITGVFTSVYTPKKTKRPTVRKSPKKLKIARSKTFTIEEDIALLEKGIALCSSDSSTDESDDIPIKTKRKPKAKNTPRQKKPKLVEPEPEPEIKKDIRSDLLAEWDDDEDDEEKIPKPPSEIQEEASSFEVEKDVNVIEHEEAVTEEKQKSCFDFEDDEDNHTITALEGRKIPRVIPPSGKRKSLEISDSDDCENTFDKKLNSQIQECNEKENTNVEAQLEAFTNILNSTAVPKIPDGPQTFKCEQNFHNAKTIKFPDKPEERKSEVATKLTNPKKRFAKTFEDETKNSNREDKNHHKTSGIVDEGLKIEASVFDNTETISSNDITKIEVVDTLEEISNVKPKPNIPQEFTSTKSTVVDIMEHNVKSVETEYINLALRRSKSSEKKEKCYMKSLEKQCNSEYIINDKATIKQSCHFYKDSDLLDETKSLKEKYDIKFSDEEHEKNVKEEVKPFEVAKLKTQVMSKLKSPRKSAYGKYGAYESYRCNTKVEIDSPEINASASRYDKEMRKPKFEKKTESLKKIAKEYERIEDRFNRYETFDDEDDEIQDEDFDTGTNKTRKSLIVEEMLSNLIAETVLPKKKSLVVEPIPTLDNDAKTLKGGQEEKQEISVEEKIVHELQQKTEDIIEEQLGTIEPNTQFHKDDSDTEAMQEEANPLQEEAVTPQEGCIPVQKEIISPQEEAISPPKGAVALYKGSSPLQEDIIPLEEEVIPLPEEAIPLEKETIPPLQEDASSIQEDASSIQEDTSSLQENDSSLQEDAISEQEEDISLQDGDIPLQDEVIPLQEETSLHIDIPVNENLSVEEEISLTSPIPEKPLQEEINSKETIAFKEDIVKLDKIEPKPNIDSSESSLEDSTKTASDEDEMVSIEGNLTVVTENDLADKQVEITADSVQAKPITLSNFSMDFCEEKVEDNFPQMSSSKVNIETHERYNEHKHESKENKMVKAQETSIDFEELIPINYNLKNVTPTKEESVFNKMSSLEVKEKTNIDETIVAQELKDATTANEAVNLDIASVLEDEKASAFESVDSQIPETNKEITDDEKRINEESRIEESEEQAHLDNLMHYHKEELLQKVDRERIEIEEELRKKMEQPPSPGYLMEEEILVQECKVSNKQEDSNIKETSDKIVDFTCQKQEVLLDEDTDAQEHKAAVENVQEEVIPSKKEEVKNIDKENVHTRTQEFKNVDKESICTKKRKKQKEETFLSLESEVAKITDTNAEHEVTVKDIEQSTSSTKLLEILTDKPKTDIKNRKSVVSVPRKIDVKENLSSKILSRSEQNSSKMLLKTTTPGTSKSKPIILSEKIIRPMSESEKVSVKKVTSKRTFQDVEDIDTFIIQKPTKKLAVCESESVPDVKKKVSTAPKGKARILQQTIITPTGHIIQPTVSQNQNDDNIFDINSMPIIMGDQILTPDSIESIPVSEKESETPVAPLKKNLGTSQVKLLNKCATSLVSKDNTHQSLVKMNTSNKHGRIHKVYQTSTSKLTKNSPTIITQSGKPGKYMIVSTNSTPTGNKYTVGKRQSLTKRIVSVTKPQTTESTGTKIMIVTDDQGQQQRIFLTPSQQKLLAGYGSNARIKTSLKGNILQKISKESVVTKGANIISQTIVSSKGHVTTLANQSVASGGQITPPMSSQVKIETSKLRRTLTGQKVYMPSSKPTSGQRTIIIKNPQGQTVKRIQGKEDTLLDQQVAEQIQAINRATAKTQTKDFTLKTRTSAKKSYGKRPIITDPKVKSTVTSLASPGTSKSSSVPPLAPISPTKKVEAVTPPEEIHTNQREEKSEEVKRPPHQLVIQDGFGNQTTITEGQILALPSEAVDGQPQSYVLVTLDETGNLAPLNNEALMSLDPNLNLGGDLGNMVLQIEQGATSENNPTKSTPQETIVEPSNALPHVEHEELVENKETPNEELPESVPEIPQTNVGTNVQAVAVTSGETGQQFIITGDPIAAQKFLETLTEGNTDLANLLANTEGNVLIQAEGQQILINTDSENQMLLTMNPENLNVENSEGSGNPIFAGQPKNQDILAAALADTDVFQQEQLISHSSKPVQSQLSPNSPLYPINVGNVLETNTMSSPIMTPLEIPSTNTKKIDDDVDILSQVPKNVDLPITITDPNISQTVAQQQVSLMAAELQTNLELPLAIQDPTMSVTSSDMNSPNYVYSLPSLDDNESEINQKGFTGSISMPLLTEEPEDALVETSSVLVATSTCTTDSADVDISPSKIVETQNADDEADLKKSAEIELSCKDDKEDSFMVGEGLCAIRGGICNSLSEPPPDMFDFSVGNTNFDTNEKNDETNISADTLGTHSDGSNALLEQDSSDMDKTIGSTSSTEDTKPDMSLFMVNTNSEVTSPSTTTTDDSCEIPVQPEIVTELSSKNFDENGDANFETKDFVGSDEI